jgi:hypothetical protein
MQLNVTPSGDSATPLSSPHCARSVRVPTRGGDAIHCPLAPQANVAPDAVKPRLYRVLVVQASPRTAPRSTYGTHATSVPSHDTGYADALVADTIGAAMNPDPNATAAMSLMGLSVCSSPRFASTMATVDAAHYAHEP